MSATHGSLFDTTAGTLSCGPEYMRKEGGIFPPETLSMGRSHRRQITRALKGSCKPMQASALMLWFCTVSWIIFIFSYFPFYWRKVKPENYLLQNKPASTNRPSYCLLFVTAFGLLFYFSQVLEKMIWRWHESVKHLNNCHLCNIFSVLPQP